MKERRKKSTSAPHEDSALVKAFQAGEKAAFDRLVLKHKDRLFNLCYWFLGDYQEANDSAQEAFIRAYRSLNKFRSESTFSTWLYRIAVNTCKNRLKSLEYRLRKKMVWLDGPGKSEGSNPPTDIEDESHSPVIELERKERMALIRKAVDSLPSEQKTVVVLRDIDGLSYEEIASIAGLNLGTVKSRLARARLGLRKRLGRAI
ncbi:MAG: sigma-70 family RNA polymerase sigma factor [Deltaproteobacteria bacterium]|nr:sigma-70 family RNA polymerase sigma factor [Deltaproteobacteria bacterium]MDL1962324.1 sigma-70 family RNA polymerase sigma factor [Deltaproteobacteria bacterium]